MIEAPPRSGRTIFVEAPARLHFGVLDLNGALGRWFGGLGTAAPEPTLLVSAEAAGTLTVHGEDAARAGEFARRILSRFGVRGGAHLRVERALPPHAGLGSGTQLALAVGHALAGLYGIAADSAMLARTTGRAGRSGIGTRTFDGGGLVVEGGRPPDVADRVAPLIARLPFPPEWRIVIAIPDAPPSLSGTAEAQAFAELHAPERDAQRVAHLVLMALLPALIEDDIETFGHALSTIQQINGDWFLPAQGGRFASARSAELVGKMAEWGALGTGQSSWGPTVFGIVHGESAGRILANRVRSLLNGTGAVYTGAFRNEGARVWWV